MTTSNSIRVKARFVKPRRIGITVRPGCLDASANARGRKKFVPVMAADGG